MNPNQAPERELLGTADPQKAWGPGSILNAGAETAAKQTLFVVRRGQGDSLQAVVRGHILELADPTSSAELAPTPADMLVASFASALAWSARAFLRTYQLPDDVSVSANWRTDGDLPRLDEIELSVTVSRHADAVRPALAALLTETISRSATHPVVQIRLDATS
jgi:uncharacterized OsmC-like protein